MLGYTPPGPEADTPLDQRPDTPPTPRTRGRSPPPRCNAERYGRQAGGTHPTVMNTCSQLHSTLEASTDPNFGKVCTKMKTALNCFFPPQSLILFLKGSIDVQIVMQWAARWYNYVQTGGSNNLEPPCFLSFLLQYWFSMYNSPRDDLCWFGVFQLSEIIVCDAPASFESFITFPIGENSKETSLWLFAMCSFLNHLITVTGNNDTI